MHRYFAEALATFFLVFLGTFFLTQSFGYVWLIAIGFGISLATVYYFFQQSSGAHANPAVSVGMWLHGNLSTHDVPAYLIAQFSGAVAAGILLIAVVGGGYIGETMYHISPLPAFVLETVCTFVLAGTYIVATSKVQSPLRRAMLLGGVFTLLHVITIPLSGGGFNPARSIAPLVVAIKPDASVQVGVFVASSFLGGTLAGVLLRGRFAPPEQEVDEEAPTMTPVMEGQEI